MSAADCVACRGVWPPAAHRVADCGPAVAYLHEDQYFPGWTVLVLKRHASELFQLDAAERAALIEALASVARAVAEAFDAVKINYELLGNQLPHIHWHVIPRGADDPSPRQAVWAVAHEVRAATAEERRARIAAIRARLAP